MFSLFSKLFNGGKPEEPSSAPADAGSTTKPSPAASTSAGAPTANAIPALPPETDKRGFWSRLLGRAPEPGEPIRQASDVRGKASSALDQAMPSVGEKTSARIQPPASSPSPSGPDDESSRSGVKAVETVSLSLKSIIGKLPDDLKGMIGTQPKDTDMIALPLATILRQLPSGSVKMSLGSLHRQAPDGVFKSQPEDPKRLVDVPLAEIFKRVSPAVLKKREQKLNELAQEGFDLFGDENNPRSVAPATYDPGTRKAPDAAKPAPAASDSAPAPGAASAPVGSDTPAATTFALAAAELIKEWPEAIRAQVAAIANAEVTLPVADVTAGLARGHVSFKWGQIKGWIKPEPETPFTGDDGIEVPLALRIVAPAFMKATKGAPKPGAMPAARKKITVDDAIPELFNAKGPVKTITEIAPASPAAESPAPAATPALKMDVPAPAPTPAAPAPAPAPEPVPTPAPVLKMELKPEAPAPAAEKKDGKPKTKDKPAEAPATTAAPAPAAPVPAAKKTTIGEVLGKPDKTDWSPREIVTALAAGQFTAGGFLATGDGLVVAEKLPEGLQGEVLAAFLPQVFARMNNYAGEMKIGEVDEVVLRANNAAFAAYKLGPVYFAALGKPGQDPDLHELRLVAAEIRRQNS